jgi:hypothetical protein
VKTNIHLILEQGATIEATASPKPGEQSGYNGRTYDPAEPNTPWEDYQDYGHNHLAQFAHLGENIHDFSITGPGLIDGEG